MGNGRFRKVSRWILDAIAFVLAFYGIFDFVSNFLAGNWAVNVLLDVVLFVIGLCLFIISEFMNKWR